MKKLRILSLVIIILALLISCARSREAFAPAPEMNAPGRGQYADKTTTAGETTIANTEEQESSKPLDQNRKIIRTALISLYVEDFDGSVEKIENIAKQLGGLVANKSKEKSTENIYGTIVLWIPSERLMESVDEISKTGKVRSSNITAEDISDQYYDLDARLKSKKKQEERLLSLLDKPDTKLDELLKLEQELARVRGEIETMEGRKRQWDQRVAYSTVTINVTQDVQAVHEPDDIWKPLRQAFRDARPTFLGSVESLMSFIGGLMILIIALIPWAIVSLFVWWIFKMLFGKKWREFRAKRKEAREKKLTEKMAGSQAGISAALEMKEKENTSFKNKE